MQTSGMGCPSAGIVYEELVMLGAQRLVRVGTCGGLQDGMRMGDTAIGISATADDTAALRVAQMPSYAPAASFDLLAEAVRLSRDQGAVVHVGPIVSSGVFYDPDPTTFARWKRVGHVGVEMEREVLNKDIGGGAPAAPPIALSRLDRHAILTETEEVAQRLGYGQPLA